MNNRNYTDRFYKEKIAMYLFHYMDTISKVIAVKSSSAKAIDAIIEKPELFQHVCTNKHLTENQWDFLYKKSETSSNFYDLAASSKTLEQANKIMENKYLTVKSGLIRSKNPYVDAKFIEKIYKTYKNSTTVVSSLLTRSDLSLEIAAEIISNQSSYYSAVRAIIVNENMDADWILNYFKNSDSKTKKEFIERIPSIIDNKPYVIKPTIEAIIASSVNLQTRLEFKALSGLAESRHIERKDAENILSYISKTKRKNTNIVVVALSLLGNPTLEPDAAEKVYEFFENTNLPKTLQQKARAEKLINNRRQLGKTYLKTGWDYDFSVKEAKLYDLFADQTYHYSIRKGVRIDRERAESAQEYNLSIDKAQNFKCKAEKQELVPWMWGREAARVIWYIEEYINQIPLEEQKEVWANLVNLGDNWDGTILELLEASCVL